MKKIFLFSLAALFLAANAFAFTAVGVTNSSFTSAYAGGMAGVTGWYGHGYQTVAEVGGMAGADNGAIYMGFGWGQDSVLSQSDAFYNANSNQNAGGWHGSSSSHADTQGSAFSVINIQRW